MDKFIFTARGEKDLIGLLVNTKAHYKNAVWDPSSVSKSDEPVYCSEWDLYLTYEKGDGHEVDNYIMSGDVPVGGLVVTCDGNETPVYGYICGNGTDWFRIFLPKDIIDAVMSFYPPIKYGVRHGLSTRRFNSREELKSWVKEGFAACDGAEQRHYAHMLVQLDDGLNILDYDD